MAPNTSIDEDNLEDLMNQIWRDGEGWSDTTLTVSFFSSPDDYWQDQGVDSDDFTAFNAAARNNFMMAAQLWSDLADVSITSSGVGDDGQIRAFGWDQPSEGWAAKVGSSPGFNDHMDVQVNTGWVNGDGDTGATGKSVARDRFVVHPSHGEPHRSAPRRALHSVHSQSKRQPPSVRPSAGATPMLPAHSAERVMASIAGTRHWDRLNGTDASGVIPGFAVVPDAWRGPGKVDATLIEGSKRWQ